MKVIVKLFATLREGRWQIKELEISHKSTVSDICESIGINPSDVSIVMINGRISAKDKVIKEQDVIALFPPVGGG